MNKIVLIFNLKAVLKVELILIALLLVLLASPINVRGPLFLFGTYLIWISKAIGKL